MGQPPGGRLASHLIAPLPATRCPAPAPEIASGHDICGLSPVASVATQRRGWSACSKLDRRTASADLNVIAHTLAPLLHTPYPPDAPSSATAEVACASPTPVVGVEEPLVLRETGRGYMARPAQRVTHRGAEAKVPGWPISGSGRASMAGTLQWHAAQAQHSLKHAASDALGLRLLLGLQWWMPRREHGPRRTRGPAHRAQGPRTSLRPLARCAPLLGMGWCWRKRG